ncbi:AbrB/MazE/SpoVT family DNA-binding domain-containing protein, partial [Asticcacaulis tiandongensis]|uniref:AbrB/MazE/SpoVT family DNA-binding domain-containing protein n=1 Tax=Asticcacaulis tiandongensis TaxID=2565365 RepID=UPI001C63C1D8
EGCSASCSTTIRTARTRTSGENLFVVLLVIDPTSHELGSPANPARFNPRGNEVEKEDITKSNWDVEWQCLDNGDLQCLIPDEIVAQLQLREGQKAHVWVMDGTIFIKPKRRLSQKISRYLKSAAIFIRKSSRL